jgi:U3 small nucleolar RNA-associated protein 12
MQVKFVPKTHYFFTASKDKTVKYWDGDKFELIMTLDGHKGEVWSLVVSSSGYFIATGSHDRSIRVWEQSDEQLFLEEERENELDALFESSLEGRHDSDPNKKEAESGFAGKRTIETIRSGEQLLEAIEIANMEKTNWENYQKDLTLAEKTMSEEDKKERRKKGLALISPPIPSPLMMGMSPSLYLLHVLRRIRPAELEGN